jgi:hypothetical protein
MVTQSDSILNKMSKMQLREVISGYEKLTSNLKYEILCLKYALFLESPSLAIKVPVQVIEEDVDDVPDIPVIDPNLSIKKKDVMFQ